MKEELELSQNFFYLLQQRFGDKLRLEVNVDDFGGQLPPLSLQILLENAVKHNVASSRQPLTISINRKGDRLEVRNRIQPKIKPENSTGFGLNAIRRRYHLLGQPGIEVKQIDNHFVVLLPIL